MSNYDDSQRGVQPPTAASNYSPQRLAGTGTTEASNSRAFAKDRIHMMTVGVQAVYVLFGENPGGGANVGSANGALLPAGTVFTFRASKSARYAYVEAADGASAYEVTVWQREG